MDVDNASAEPPLRGTDSRDSPPSFFDSLLSSHSRQDDLPILSFYTPHLLSLLTQSLRNGETKTWGFAIAYSRSAFSPPVAPSSLLAILVGRPLFLPLSAFLTKGRNSSSRLVEVVWPNNALSERVGGVYDRKHLGLLPGCCRWHE